MPRRRKVTKREVLPDPKFHNKLVAKFINAIMRRGKKSIAEKILYTALDIVEDKADQTGLEVFEKAVANVRPIIEVKSRRVGGATYQVPIEVPPARSIALAMRWLIQYSRARGEKTMAEKLAAELIMASRKEGASIKKREDTHKMAEANKAFAHFRW
ncbi:30S ribosomal protein S7 [bacterium BMS3Abin05]|nr:30S ribosomal protein S7 [bacterium BMS3Abin05]GBE28799.1 30S ribosomal protein S7 [bacterium BMS3Bbin03]HDZ11877.1 30S ribosomal protein S7 [Bacteroidota bacterium]